MQVLILEKPFPPLRQPPILHLIHHICHIHGGDSVGYQNYGAASGVFFQRLEDDAFIEGIQIGSWFIQK